MSEDPQAHLHRSSSEPYWTRNGRSVPVVDIPTVNPATLRELCASACAHGARMVALCVLRGVDQGAGRAFDLFAVLADDMRGQLGLFRAEVQSGGHYPALSATLPAAQAFERELYEVHGLHPQGHPWLKSLTRHPDLEPPPGPSGVPPLGDELHPFFQVEGRGIHEVAVGPVHAGIIEPGHFRFQCAGETVLHLEIQLGYQHRGAEGLLLHGTPARRLVVAESIAGDTAVGHAWAYCQALESLAEIEPPLYAQAIRAIALELERLSNHVGDLGALCNDVGYQPGAAYFGRLRGEFLNLLLELSGSRFGRSLLQPGGVRFGLPVEAREAFLERLARAERDVVDTAHAMFHSATLCSRFEHTGMLSREVAQALGLVGLVARASGCDRDARRDHPVGFFRFAHIPVSLLAEGDVMARALIRRLEIHRSIAFVREQVNDLGGEAGLRVEVPALQPEQVVVSMIEGWRGEIVHLARTGPDGSLADYRVIDPSVHNWFGLAIALRGNQISDFPLCNKSFNLSYAGHDR